MPIARLAVATDLESLLELFEHAPVSRHVTSLEAAREIWTCTLAQDGVDVFVTEEDAQIVATCMLITAPNLLREGRKLGYIDNVVTLDGYLRRGHGSAVIQAALDAARVQGCYHVMLQSGRKDPNVHRFYERQGFVGNLRIGYVAQCPSNKSLNTDREDAAG